MLSDVGRRSINLDISKKIYQLITSEHINILEKQAELVLAKINSGFFTFFEKQCIGRDISQKPILLKIKNIGR